MPRIVGVNIPEEKKIEVALTYVYGIGLSLSRKILTNNKINFSKKAKDLTPEEINKIREDVEKNYKIEGELKREHLKDIKRIKDINCWRGEKHKKGLPVRGQRTKTNSRTVRGNVRRTIGSGKKGPPAPK